MAISRPSNQKASSKSVVGLAFPFRRENGELPLRLKDTDLVKSDLLALFQTPIRTRIMRPTVGHTVDFLLFESQGDLFKARMNRAIRQAIYMNEPRVRVISVSIEEDNTLVNVLIVYETQGVKDSVDVSFERPI